MTTIIYRLIFRDGIFRRLLPCGVVRGLAFDIRWSGFSRTVGVGLLGSFIVGMLGIKADTNLIECDVNGVFGD